MNIAVVKDKATELFSEMSFAGRIENEAEYEHALELMEALIEDYDAYLPLIDALSMAIERWENDSDSFSTFNQKINALDDGVAVLITLMDQYNLKADDLKAEIGSKSLVSMILNGSRKLTRDHIQALSQRFNLSPSIFFNHVS